MSPAVTAAAVQPGRATVPCAHCALPVAAPRAAPDAAPSPAPAAAPPETLAFCCVGCRLAHAVSGADGERGLLEARLLVAAFLSMGIMTASLVLYAEDVLARGDEPGLAALGGLLRVALGLLSLPVLLLLGVPLARGAWLDARAGRVRMDGLIVLAVAAAWALSVAHTLRGAGPVYYETAAMVLVLVTLGRRLEAHARTRGRDARAALAACLPDRAHRVEDVGSETDVPPAALRAGERCRVRPGEAAPADLVVLAGHGDVVTAHLTGEQVPRAVGPGDRVPAGAINGHAALLARVEHAAGADSVARLRELLETPLGSAPAIRLADRLAGWLALLAVAVALLATARVWSAGDAGAALRVGLSVLLVACPCALGLATPLAYRALRVALARRGILVHDAGALERAADVDLVLLDKTGTLTEPLGALRCEGEARPGAFDRLAALVAASGHALARSVQQPRPLAAPTEVVTVPGGGVAGRFGALTVRAGSPEWLARDGARWPDDLAAARERARRDGATLVACAEDGDVVGLGALRQRLRPGASEALSALTSRGVGAVVLSGDHEAAVAALAAPLGLRWHGAQTPADKLARVESLRAEGRAVLVVGDGMNDAPALRAADVGIALASGTASARSQSHIELVGDDLRCVPVLLEASVALRRTVRGNLAWTVAYNLVALAAAAAGLLHPLVAVAAMVVSSLVVSARSQRLAEWSPAAAAPRAGAAQQRDEHPQHLATAGHVAPVCGARSIAHASSDDVAREAGCAQGAGRAATPARAAPETAA